MPIFNEDKATYANKLREQFPGKELLTVTDLSVFCGISDSRTIKKIFNITKPCYIAVERAASVLSKL